MFVDDPEFYLCVRGLCAMYGMNVVCFHTTESQHWEYYLYGQNRCTGMSGSHWLGVGGEK